MAQGRELSSPLLLDHTRNDAQNHGALSTLTPGAKHSAWLLSVLEHLLCPLSSHGSSLVYLLKSRCGAVAITV